ncbi:MAG: hypothetical protein ACM3VS_10245 [Candidatus Dadabacteria bacterium]
MLQRILAALNKIISIVTILILFISIAGYHLLFLLERWEAKCDIEQLLHKGTHKDIKTIVVENTRRNKEIQWVNDHEFRWNGKMYDIVHKQTNGSKTIIFCIADERESELIDNYIQLTQHDGKDQNSTISLLRLLTTPCIIANYIYSIPNNAVCSGEYPYFSPGLLLMTADIILPPPRICV